MKQRIACVVIILTIVLTMPASLPSAVAEYMGYIEVIPPKYDYMSSFNEDMSAVELGGLWGYIDKTGKEVVPLKYDHASSFSEGMAKVKLNGKWGFIDKTGREVIPLTLTYDETGSFYGNLAEVRRASKRGFIDKTGKEVVSPIYDVTWYSAEGLIPVLLKKIRGDEPTEMVWGFIDDATGCEVIPPKYKWVSHFNEGLAMVVMGGKSGFIGKTGREVVSLKYDDSFSTPYAEYKGYSEGLANVRLNGKWGYIDKTGQEVVPPKYDYASSFSEGIAAVALNGKWGFIDKTGQEIVPLVYNNVRDFSEGMAAVELGGKWGYIDKTGKVIVPLKYDGIPGYHEDSWAANFDEGWAAVTLDGKWGFVDNTGREVVPLKYDNVFYWRTEGMAEVELGGKWGFVNSTGEEAVPLKYDWTDCFSNGFARVKSNEKMGVIDMAGREVIPIQYDVLWNANIVFDSTECYFYFELGGKYGLLRITPDAANPTSSTVYVDGKAVSFDAYNIDGSNYFKLRDLAYTLSGTVKQFEVVWDGANNAIILTNGKPYTPVGGEMMDKGAESKTYIPATSRIILDGNEVTFTAYNIGGNNYFKLRDVGQALDFSAVWDGSKNTIIVNTSKGYTPD